MLIETQYPRFYISDIPLEICNNVIWGYVDNYGISKFKKCIYKLVFLSLFLDDQVSKLFRYLQVIVKV